MLLFENHLMNDLGKHELRSVLIETGCYTLLFGIALFFPITIYYDNTNYVLKEKPLFIGDVPFYYIFPFYFVIAIVAVFSFKREFIRVMSILIIIVAFLTFLIMAMLLHWSGGAFQPDFGIGIWLCNLALFILLIRMFAWSEYRNIQINQTFSRICEKLTFVLSAALIVLLVGLYANYMLERIKMAKQYNKPVRYQSVNVRPR